jgi:hypothetical protein
MENEYMKRGYLLPEGCKDLIDVLKPKVQRSVAQQQAPPRTLPPITGELSISAQMTAMELAAVLKQKPFNIIADLMELGIFATVVQQLDFDTMSRVVRMYGFAAKKSA